MDSSQLKTKAGSFCHRDIANLIIALLKFANVRFLPVTAV